MPLSLLATGEQGLENLPGRLQPAPFLRFCSGFEKGEMSEGSGERVCFPPGRRRPASCISQGCRQAVLSVPGQVPGSPLGCVWLWIQTIWYSQSASPTFATGQEWAWGARASCGLWGCAVPAAGFWASDAIPHTTALRVGVRGGPLSLVKTCVVDDGNSRASC